MPNWCDNILDVYGPPEEVARFKAQAVGYCPFMTDEERARTEPCEFSFHNLFPIPTEVLVKGDEGSAVYHWECENWGVKWGAECDTVYCCFDETIPYRLHYRFDTPWDPPIKFLKHVSKNWPSLVFFLGYTGEGIEFIGVAKAKAGKIVDYRIDS